MAVLIASILLVLAVASIAAEIHGDPTGITGWGQFALLAVAGVIFAIDGAASTIANAIRKAAANARGKN